MASSICSSSRQATNVNVHSDTCQSQATTAAAEIAKITAVEPTMVGLLQEEKRRKEREIEELRVRAKHMSKRIMLVQAKTMHQMVKRAAERTAGDMEAVRRK
jgi:UPF0288 family protein (methanogenesis marker protein 3)